MSATAAPIPTGAATTLRSAAVTGLACPVVGECFGAGEFFNTNMSSNYEQGLLYSFTGGVWTVQSPPGPTSGVLGGWFDGIDCPSTTWCAAYGTAYTSDFGGDGEAWVVTIRPSGIASTALPLPSDAASVTPASVVALSCATVGMCTGVVTYTAKSGNREYALVTLSNGTWSSTTPTLPSGFTSISGISAIHCPSASWCALTGTYFDTSGFGGSFIETDENGVSKFLPAPAPSSAPDSAASRSVTTTSLSCPVPGWCEALATAGNGYNLEAVRLDSGQLTGVTLPKDRGYTNNSAGDIVCAAQDACTATAISGNNSDSAYNALIMSLSDGAWTGKQPPDGKWLNPISCPNLTWCAAGGSWVTSGLIETIQYGGEPTKISVNSSANPVAVNSSVTYTATIKPTPKGGVVVFSDVSGPVANTIPGCGSQPVDPVKGTATCTVTYSETTEHSISADYLGTSSFAQSGPSTTLTQYVQL